MQKELHTISCMQVSESHDEPAAMPWKEIRTFVSQFKTRFTYGPGLCCYCSRVNFAPTYRLNMMEIFTAYTHTSCVPLVVYVAKLVVLFESARPGCEHHHYEDI